MSHVGFIDQGYKPNLTKDLLATFYMEPNGPFEEAADAVAGESSIGSWTDLSTLKPEVAKKLKATVYYINQKQNIIKIAYPLDLFELGSIPQFMSSIGGNIYSMKVVKNLRLLDVEFPTKYIKSFQGPAFGIEGIRKVLKNKDRIILGSIIKPKVGLTAVEHSKVAYDVWRNGIDLVKDDENLTDMTFNRFDERVKRTLAMRDKVEKETGQIKVYACNVTAPPDEMLRRAKLVKSLGGRCVMVDIVSTGLDNVQYLRKQKLGLIIHGHRAGHSMFTRNPKHGMTMLMVSKLARLAGIDQLHTGTVVGKMEGSADEVLTVNELLREDWHEFNSLKEDWSSIKPTMPIASGGMHPGLLPKLVEILGSDLIANFGGGVHGHQGGSIAGAKACRQAAEAIVREIDLADYAVTNPELKVALDQWGNIKYKYRR
ncbi:type III ribulose-bisphosphate carboxylase [Candidatus Falkowbacteria bacterium]|nr:type III ribulose-bisphosphate carboxylase [Candidatus Falkowbacteria bacterium]MBT5503270.1 type III ribulose-bisphosphate carboxylase [Candidatus Falkowbacteria bacterium]MBT6574269.1 type III ribulose-bisphosphate carboxylase [Candidatus Falkowbacteria bacterium]MBT7348173.1 type III ribulose-bisphosphate carboxylase [Candidatus Falkowbacteria bacterium]